METNSDLPFALTPVYSTTKANQSILLYKGSVAIQIDSQKVATGESNFYLNWLPSPEVIIEINSVNLDIPVQDFQDRAFSDKVQLVLIDIEIETSVYLNKFNCSPNTHQDSWSIDVTGELDKVVWSKSDVFPEYILGHLVNFPKLLGDWISYTQSGEIKRSRARAILTTENWKIIIDGVSEIDTISKELCRLGGYAITSTIKIQPLPDKLTSIDNIKTIIEALNSFLSFTIGRYSPVVLPVGFDLSGTEIWYEWRNWLIPRWEDTISWFSGKENWSSLPQVFPGFIKIWDNHIWREPIRRSIVWYIESNSTTADPLGKIIWVQSALELLSWTYFVSTNRKTEQEFKDLGGMCEKIKAFLNALNIPASFSDTFVDLEHLRRFIKVQKVTWEEKEKKFSGKKSNKKNTNINSSNHAEIADQSLESYLYLKAFVEVRNDIVHPKQRSGIILSPGDPDYENSFWIRVEALNLGLWYLELSLLHLFEYQGKYINRLKSRELETVPWAEVMVT